MSKNKKKKKAIRVVFNLIFILMAIFSAFYIISYTNVFEVREVEVLGHKKMDENEILNLSGVISGENLIFINNDTIAKRVEKGIFVKTVEVSKRLPNTLRIQITERTVGAQVKTGEETTLIDFEGVAIEHDNAPHDDLFMIEAIGLTQVTLGEPIHLKNEEFDFNKIVELVYYITINDFDYVSKIEITEDAVYAFTNNDVIVKLNHNADMRYQILFTREIINDRINSNQSLNGLIDFTKGEHPVYFELDNSEVRFEE
jgi:cell division protein FtsQ